ncbi:MAG TPA: hypothetical protein VF330_29100 [Lentzea sp.]
MAILVDDSVEKIMSVYDAAFDLIGFARLRPAPQECRVGERSAGSVLAVVPLLLTQRPAQMGLIPDKRAAEAVAAKILAPVDTDQPERLISRLLAMAAAIWHNWQTGMTSKRSLTAFDH